MLWRKAHDFSRFDLETRQWVNDHVAEYEVSVGEDGNERPTGRSRIVPKN